MLINTTKFTDLSINPNDPEGDEIYRFLASVSASDPSPEMQNFIAELVQQYGGSVPTAEQFKEALQAILSKVDENGADIWVRTGLSPDQLSTFLTQFSLVTSEYGDSWQPVVPPETEADSLYLQLLKIQAGASSDLKSLINTILSSFSGKIPSADELKNAIEQALHLVQKNGADLWIWYSGAEDELNQLVASLKQVAEGYQDDWHLALPPKTEADSLYLQLLKIQAGASSDLKSLIHTILSSFSGKIPSADELKNAIEQALHLVQKNGADLWIWYSGSADELNQWVASLKQVAEGYQDDWHLALPTKTEADSLYLELLQLQTNASPDLKALIDSILKQFNGKVPTSDEFKSALNNVLQFKDENDGDLWFWYKGSIDELNGFLSSINSVAQSSGDCWQTSLPPKTEGDTLYLSLKEFESTATPSMKAFIEQLIAQFGGKIPSADQFKAAFEALLLSQKGGADVWMQFNITQDELMHLAGQLQKVSDSYGDGWGITYAPFTSADQLYAQLQASFGIYSGTIRQFLITFSLKYGLTSPTPDQIAEDAKEFLGSLSDPTIYPGVSLNFVNRFIAVTGVTTIDPSLLSAMMQARSAYASATSPEKKGAYLDLLKNGFGPHWVDQTQSDLQKWAQTQFADRDAYWQYPFMSEDEVRSYLSIIEGKPDTSEPTNNDRYERNAYAYTLKYSKDTPQGAIMQQVLEEWEKYGSYKADSQDLENFFESKLVEASKYGKDFVMDYYRCFIL